jgi:hypothetical protein
VESAFSLLEVDELSVAGKEYFKQYDGGRGKVTNNMRRGVVGKAEVLIHRLSGTNKRYGGREGAKETSTAEISRFELKEVESPEL